MGSKIAIRSAWVLGAAVSLAGLARLAWAGPLDTSVVDQDATWMFHLNVEAGMASTCGRFTTDTMQKDPGMQEAVKKFGLDPTKEIKGFTVYGFKPGEDDGVAVLVTTTAVDSLGEKLEAQGLENFETHKSDGAVLYTWKLDGHTWHMAIRPTTKGDERFVLLASTQKQLDAGLAVVAGSKPSVKSLDENGPAAGMLVKPSENSIVFIAARGLGDSPKFKTSFIKEAKSLFIDVGEDSNAAGIKETYAKAAISAKDAPTATNMQQMIQGMIGFASIAAKDNDAKDMVTCLQALKVSADGSKVIVTARTKSEDLLNELKDLNAAIKAGGDGTMEVSLQKGNTKDGDKKKPDKADDDDKKAPEKKPDKKD